MQPAREAVSYRGLFSVGWFGVREKHCLWLKIYDRLRASEQADDWSSVQHCKEEWTIGSFQGMLSFLALLDLASVVAG